VTIGLAAVLATHPLPEAAAETTSASESEAPTSTTPPAAATPEQATIASEPTATEPTPVSEPAPALAPEPAERTPLRVTALGWELLAPALLANDGLAPGQDSEFRRLGLDVELSVARSLDELEAKLARGGGVIDGADVALLPLPSFVASYEQLRALSPEVFFVIGWSHGRDVVIGPPGLLTDSRGGHASALELVGAPGHSATMLALFALDEIGVDTREIELVAPGSDAAKHVQLRAVERSLLGTLDGLDAARVDARDLLLTSADTPRLIPMVAVAPAGYLHAHTDELARFARIWLDELDTLEADVPAAARRIAREPGAPEAVVLLEMLGYVSFSDLADAARLAGLSGRGAISLELLFRRYHDLWRDIGVLSTPAPEHAPLANAVITRVALAEGAPVVLAREQTSRGGHRLVLVHTVEADEPLDEPALVRELGMLAGSFARADVELRVRGDLPASKRIVGEAIERFDLDPAHVRVGPRSRGQELVSVRVWVP
jgi:hypothetical protein